MSDIFKRRGCFLAAHGAGQDVFKLLRSADLTHDWFPLVLVFGKMFEKKRESGSGLPKDDLPASMPAFGEDSRCV